MQDIEYVRSHYNIEDFIYFNHHRREEHGHLHHYAFNPVFKHFSKVFLKVGLLLFLQLAVLHLNCCKKLPCLCIFSVTVLSQVRYCFLSVAFIVLSMCSFFHACFNTFYNSNLPTLLVIRFYDIRQCTPLLFLYQLPVLRYTCIAV